METRADYVIVGSFVLALLVCLVVAVLWFARVQFNEESSHYNIYFSGSVSGLIQGSTVRYNGIPIGRVSSITLDPQDPQRVRVTIEVGANTVIKSDAVASLEVAGLTGGAFIEISGGSREAPPLERMEGERYPVIASRPSGLQQVVASVPEALQRLIDLSDRLAAVLDDRNRTAITETLENMRRVTAAAASHSGEVESTIGDGAAAMRELRTTLQTTNQTLDELRQMMAKGGELRDAVKNIDDASRKLGDAAGHMDAMVQENRPALRDFTQRGLSQMQQLVSDARALVGEMTRISDMIEHDPSRFLYGDRREGYQPR
jgi:phospholipid/cholesterol/gamma-HCH transport system substrate-binding protein